MTCWTPAQIHVHPLGSHGVENRDLFYTQGIQLNGQEKSSSCLHTDMTPRYQIFSCTCTPTWRHAIRSCLALAHRHDATLSDLLLHLHTDMMPRYQIFSCTCTPTWRRAIRYSLALAHRHVRHAIRSKSCTCTPTWRHAIRSSLALAHHTCCHAMRSSLALAHRHDATLWDLLLHLHTDMTPRYQIFSCTCTPTWRDAIRSSLALCTPTWRHAIRSSLALAHRHDATLWDLLLHLHPDMTPRYQIFSCTCTPTWRHAIRSSLATCTPTWCHAMRSSLALAHRHDATLSDLLLHLHTDMMPRYEIFSCTCTPTWCHAMRSSLALAHRNDATLSRSSLALAHRHDATLWDLLSHLHTDMTPRYQIFSCTCTPTWCHAMRSSLALAHRHDATLSDPLLALGWGVGEGSGCNNVRWLLHTDFMLRNETLPSCSSSNMTLTMNFLKLQTSWS